MAGDDAASRVGARAMGTPCSVMILSAQSAASVLRLSPQKFGKFGKFGKFDAGPPARPAVVEDRRRQTRACTRYLPLSGRAGRGEATPVSAECCLRRGPTRASPLQEPL